MCEVCYELLGADYWKIYGKCFCSRKCVRYYEHLYDIGPEQRFHPLNNQGERRVRDEVSQEAGCD